MDSYLSVIGIALSFAGLVPALLVKKSRFRLIGVAFSIALIGIVGLQFSRSIIEGRRLDKVKDTVIMLFSTNNSLTLEQVMFELNRGSYSTRATAVDFATAAIVVDELVKRGHLHSKLIETESGKKKYLVRIFNSINWPIP